MIQHSQPISFTMNQAEIHSHPAVCKATSYFARDCSGEMNKDLSELARISSTNFYIVEVEVNNPTILRFPWSWDTIPTYNSHSAMNTTNAYSARDCRKRLNKVTVVLFSVMHPTPLGLVTIHQSISIRYLPLRQVA